MARDAVSTAQQSLTDTWRPSSSMRSVSQWVGQTWGHECWLKHWPRFQQVDGAANFELHWISPINDLPSWLGFLSRVTTWTCIYIIATDAVFHGTSVLILHGAGWMNKRKIGQHFCPYNWWHLCDVCPNSAWGKRRGKKKRGGKKYFQFIFKFSPLYNSIMYGFLFSSHKNISNFSNLFFIIRFIFRVRVCCVRIPVMVRFIIANIRCYRCRSAGLWVGWFLHWFCEVQLHLMGGKKHILALWTFVAWNNKIWMSLPLV